MLVFESGEARVSVAPMAGGRVAQIEVRDGAGWLPLLYAPDAPVASGDPLGWGSFPMLPWPNRVAGGRFTFDGVTYELPVNDAAAALHGVGFARPWTVDDASATSCELSLVVDDPAAWPWPMRAVQRIEALDDGLRQTIEIHALGGARFPAGCGWHPWFRRDVRPAGGDVRVCIDAEERYELHEMIPTGRLLPVDSDRDLRRYPPLGARRIDDCYRVAPGEPLRVRWDDLELTMMSSPNVTHAVAFTPDHAVCIEPQTCANDAFNLEARGIAAGVQVVDQSHPLIAQTEWRWGFDP